METEFRKAIEIAEKLEADFGAQPDYWADLARTQLGIAGYLQASGLHQEVNQMIEWGMAHYAKLAEDFPDENLYRLGLARGHRLLGINLSYAGRTAEAEAAYERAIEMGLDSTSVWAHLAAAQLSLGNMDGYRKSCAYLLEHFDQGELWQDANTVAWFCLLSPDSGVDFARVVQVAEQALTRRDRNSPPTFRHDVLNTLGVALYRAGRYQEAIERLGKSMQAHPKGGDPDDWLFLAMAHWKIGHANDARQWYDRAVEWMEKNASRNQDRRRFLAEAAALIEVEPKEP